MANSCVSHFHQSYAGTSKLIVEHAFAKKEFDPNVHRPWSKYSEGSSKNKTLMTPNTVLGIKDKGDSSSESSNRKSQQSQHKDTSLDHKKEEFLAAMGVSKSLKNSFWSNDDGLTISQNSNENKNDLNGHEYQSDSSSSELDEATSNLAVINKNDENPENNIHRNKENNANNNNDDLEFFTSKLSTKDNLGSYSEDEESSSCSSSASTDSESKVNDSKSNSSSLDKTDEKKSSFKSDEDNIVKVIKVKKDKNIIQGVTQTRSSNRFNSEKFQKKAELLMNESCSSLSSNRLFVRNLSYQTTEIELKELFSNYGNVVECHIPIDDLKKRKGYAFIRFSSGDSAIKAREELDKSDFQGRLIHVLPAKKAPHEVAVEAEKVEKSVQNNVGNDLDDGEKPGYFQTYKSKKEIERQKNASNNTTGWNASILRTDTVVDTLSSRLDIAKSEILVSADSTKASTATSAAVRLALGESYVLKENKDYFAKYGFDMEALVGTTTDKTGYDRKQKRSSTHILVKNLPYNSNQEQLLHKLLADHRVQSPQRMLIPPSKTVVLLEYEHPSEARTVFRKLAYKRFGHVPLYLEWAPLTSSKPVLKKEENDNATNERGNNQNYHNIIMNEQENDVDDSDINVSTENQTIFIKNINFATSEKDLLDHFKAAGISTRAVKIPTKITSSSKRLSMGYGFVECSSSEQARDALRKLNNSILAGHSLQLLLSSKGISNTSTKSKLKKRKKLPTKIAVKNIPFQASKSEITSLFGSFGKLKKFRLPKKFGSAQHRGFGFVEFVTGEEAATAMDNLTRTHLYGRKLVLEWAELDDNEAQETNPTSHNLTQKAKKIRF